jgi:predicted CoA-binding protein/GNAT superfamily N-acetyltransferase
MTEGVDALLMDGRIIHVRPVSEADIEALTGLYSRASPRSVYLRFFTNGVSIDREVQRLVAPGDGHVVLLAEREGLPVGVAEYEISNGNEAEMAILVDDSWQGQGIGSLLIEHLAAVARRAGIRELVGDVLANNVIMLRTSADLAPGIARDREDFGVVRVQIPTKPDERALAAAGLRDRTAQHNSLRPLLAPASVAVIGVSRFRRGVGYEMLQGIRAAGFTGRTYPVNPHAKTIDGLECYRSVDAIPEQVELAIVAVPAARVEQVIDECGAAQVRAAVVLSKGFGETGPSGAAAEARLLASVRRQDIRLGGRNASG